MPLSKHYKGHGAEVMASMLKTYKNPEKAKRVFYATENKQKGMGEKLTSMRMKGKFKKTKKY